MTDQLLPDVLSGMGTAPGITDEEMREILAQACEADYLEKHKAKRFRDGEVDFPINSEIALAAMRAVASRTRQATPAPDASAVTVDEATVERALNDMIAVRERTPSILVGRDRRWMAEFLVRALTGGGT